MNRLKKIVISFVLPFFCLLISVSSALEIEANVIMSDGYPTQEKFNKSDSFNASYTFADIYNISKNYYEDPVTNESVFNVMKDSVVDSGYNLWFGTGGASNYFLCYIWQQEYCDVAVRIQDTSDFPYVAWRQGDYTYFYSLYDGCYFRKNETKILKMTQFNNTYPMYIYGLGSIKLFPSSGTKTWDGTSYYYESSSEPDTPSLPSNAEIAQAVQAFYNSDYYKNNKDFSDFMVLYNYDTKYFDFVGHNFGSDLGQVIVPPNYEYEGYSYNQDWWKFFLRNISAEVASNLWNRYYWLYSTNDFGENITYDGKGSIRNLIDLHFSTKSIIVYSTTDYPVVKIETDDNGVLNPVEGTISGDQYTYDENLDPTTNEYNPLENFVPSNPAQSILGDVDFDAINKTFEENKDVLNIEGASWLFSANNQLINYFIGFLSLLIVFLIISRILGG